MTEQVKTSTSHNEGRERWPTLKLLSAPLPTTLLKKRQKKSLYLNALITANNYLGAPTRSCKADVPKLLEYIEHVFENQTNINKEDIYEKYEEVVKPEFRLLVEIREACLYSGIGLKRYDKFYCVLKTPSGFSKSTKHVEASYSPQWKEEFYVEMNDVGSTIVVELWVKPLIGSSYCMAKAVKNVDYIPDNEELHWFLTTDDNSTSRIRGVLTLKCAFQAEEPVQKLNVIYRHVLLCYMIFEYQLSTLGNQPWEVTPIKEDSLYGHGLGRILPDESITFLHQHTIQSGLTPFENVMCCFLVTNQCFLKTSKFSLNIVFTVLEEMAQMGYSPQKSLDPILRSTTAKEIGVTVDHCAYILYNFPTALQQNEHQATEELKTVVKFLHLVDKFYNPDVLKRITESVKDDALCNLRQLVDLKNSQMSISINVLENVRSEIRCILDTLKKTDRIFTEETNWDITYTSIAYKSVDAQLAQSLDYVMERLSKDFPIPRKHTYFEVRLYSQLSDLISYVVQAVPGISEQHMEMTKSLEWVNHDIFVSFMDILTEWHNCSITSWVEKNQKDESDPFLNYTQRLLQEWRNIIWLKPIPPTTGMLHSFGKKCATSVERLEKKIKDGISACKDDSDLGPEVYTSLFKIRNISNCINIVTAELKKHGLYEIERIKTELEKLSLGKTLINILDSLNDEVQDKTNLYERLMDHYGLEKKTSKQF